jgi:hypothetical protein
VTGTTHVGYGVDKVNDLQVKVLGGEYLREGTREQDRVGRKGEKERSRSSVEGASDVGSEVLNVIREHWFIPGFVLAKVKGRHLYAEVLEGLVVSTGRSTNALAYRHPNCSFSSMIRDQFPFFLRNGYSRREDTVVFPSFIMKL